MKMLKRPPAILTPLRAVGRKLPRPGRRDRLACGALRFVRKPWGRRCIPRAERMETRPGRACCTMRVGPG